MENQAEHIARIVREDDEMRARINAEARVTAHGLIQGYLGPDHKVTNMQSFYSALVQALGTRGRRITQRGGLALC
jgi:hypothetical protein